MKNMLILYFVGACLMQTAVGAARNVGDKPNIIFMIADDLGKENACFRLAYFHHARNFTVAFLKMFFHQISINVLLVANNSIIHYLNGWRFTNHYFHKVLFSHSTLTSILYITHFIIVILGFADIGFRNSMIYSPYVDNMATVGMVLNSSYVQPTCSP